MQLTTIPKKEQESFIASFWSMLQQLENNADNVLDKQFVEGYYQQWNRITGDNKVARWNR